MKLYNLYLTRKIIGYFVVIVTTLVLLIWFNKAMSFVEFITEKGVTLRDFLNLFLLILPWLLLMIIPVALFIAILTAYSQMNNHNEITTLKNAGLDKISLARPAINIALLFCVICYCISFFVMPYANKKLRSIKSNFRVNYASLIISPGIFENLNSLTIYVKDRDESGNLSGIFIYDNRNPEYANTITAESGTMHQDENILLYLNRGNAQRFNYQTTKTDILNFDSYVFNLSDNNQQDPSFKWKAQEMYIDELLHPPADSSEKELQTYRVELHQRITYPLFSITLALIATASILSGKFSRYGNLRHNIVAFVFAAFFVVSIMSGYSVIERYKDLVPLVYVDLLIFILISWYFLKSKRQV